MTRRHGSSMRVPMLFVCAVAAASACVPSGDVGPPSSPGGSGGSAMGQGGASGGSAGGASGSGGSVDAGGPNDTGNSTGTGGATGSGGVVGTGDAAAGGTGGVGSGGNPGGTDGGAGGGVVLPPLTPCTMPAVSRLKVWEMMTEGGSAMPNGSPLRKFGDAYEFHVAWTINGGGYGTANTPLKNAGQYANGADPTKNAVDISAEGGLTLEYATTGNTYVQIRTGTVPHGGAHFRANLPITAGQIKTVTLNFVDFRRPGGTTPPGPDVLKDAFSLTFVAGATSTVTLRQIRVGSFVPPCN